MYTSLTLTLTALPLSFLHPSAKFFSSYVHWLTGYIYQIVLAIPFLYELRVVLDWTFSKTTLFLYEWMQFEDISISLFLTACSFDFVVSEGTERTFMLYS